MKQGVMAPETKRHAEIHERAVQSLFALFEELCDGAIAVDRDARIVWINDKYRAVLGLPEGLSAIGRPIEDVIPNSMLRHVIETGRPILLDLMAFGGRWFVVTRIPLKDDNGAVTGAVGFVLYDKLDYLRPLVAKFTKLQGELVAVNRKLAAQRGTRYTFSQFIGSSPAVLDVKRLARRASQLDTTVMLLGETGTGKELLAQAIHAASARVGKPFVGVNMAAVPETLLESEFFGVAPGAFTGAERKGRDGKFKVADGGALFLDEIGEMPLQVQAKLLRVLQEQEIEPLGSNQIVKVDVRVIAATSRDLKQLVEQGRFRADLYFRLNVLPISLPPLRERMSDLEALCEVLLEDISVRSGERLREVDPAGLARLRAYDWPGNVRELRNVLERACIISDDLRIGERILSAIVPATGTAPNARPPATAQIRPLADVMSQVQRQAIEAALTASRGRKSAAAKLLGISRAALYDKLASLGFASEKDT